MKDKSRNIIHFGPGKLGLGFVVPNFSPRGQEALRLILSARYESKTRAVYETLKNKRQYDLIFESSNGPRTERIDNFELVYLDSEQNTLTDLLALPQTCLITTAVSRGISDIAAVIALGLVKRTSTKDALPINIIACENPPLDSMILKDKVRENLQSAGFNIEKAFSNVSFNNAIVDRVCAKELSINSDGNISVPTEEFSEWIILNPDGECRFAELIPSIKVVTSEEEFLFFEKRKTWLVNSTHLITAFYAWHAQIYRLQDALRNEEIYNHVRLVQEAFVNALYYFGVETGVNSEESQLDSLRKYADKILLRFRNGPIDTTSRILSAWIEWEGGLEEFKSFFNKAFLRIGEPLNILIDKGFLREKPEVAVSLTEFVYRMMKFLSMK